MSDYYDDDFDDEDDDDRSRWLDDEPDIENMCIEQGCFGDGKFGACGCCGGPLCFMHEEILCGFCTTCTSDPSFNQRMSEMHGLIDPVLSAAPQKVNSAVFDDEEIPF